MSDISPLPAASEQGWNRPRHAACRSVDGSRLFRGVDGPGAVLGGAEEAAKALCGACPVRIECRRHALAAREPFGVWGGLGAEERHALFVSDLVAGHDLVTDRPAA
ncbi:WhiB family transcriptional regulator [Kitasatospora sp. NPDC091207]|uniref:WhiB family transcriptional regulator n=1 Tax=Kitasatospora sp. NPDC091207 TaxID=3364083 RepID=UPI00382710BE